MEEYRTRSPAQSSARPLHTERDETLTERAWQGIAKIVTAHIEMLGEAGVLDGDARAALLSALESVGRGHPTGSRLVELLVSFDERLEAVSPPGVVGAATVGRGTADLLAGVTRLLLRDDLLDLASALERTRDALLDTAAAHVVTLMPAFSSGHPAQPTTLGHYLGGVIGPFGRAAAHLRAAYQAVNRSPLGAGALAGTATAIDRERLAELLGFDGLVENTFDAVAAVDHLTLCGDVAAAIAAVIERYLRDLRVWLRTEPGAFLLSDDWAGKEPGLPQLQPPSGLIALAHEARAIGAEAATLRRFATDLDYGPVTSVADDLLRRASEALRACGGVLDRTTALLTSGLQVNRALLANRAGRAFTTIGDLADFLMVEEQIEPATARDIARLTLARAREQGVEASGITPEMIDGAALLLIGREVQVEFEAISRYLAPRRFIERRTAVGAAAPAATRAYLGIERARLAADERWRTEAARRLNAVNQDLERIAANASSSG